MKQSLQKHRAPPEQFLNLNRPTGAAAVAAAALLHQLNLGPDKKLKLSLK